MKLISFINVFMTGFIVITTSLFAQETILPDKVRDVQTTADGIAWIATDNGLWYSDADTLYQLTELDGLVSDSTTSLLTDKDGKLWIGTRDGISIYSRGQFINLSYKDGLLDKTINQLYLATNNSIWAATNRGPHIFNGRRFQVSEPLKDIAVFEIQESDQHWIFLTRKGLVRIRKSSNFSSSAWQYLIPILLLIMILAAGTFGWRKFTPGSKAKLARVKFKQKSLQAQMNPHFIFNSLNSVQKYILEGDKEAAHEYLAKFSTLMRMILENSRQGTILLRDEIKTIKLYLTLEVQRFQHKFDYSITISDDEIMEIEIPTMLLQPFIENAIWHGLTNKESAGFIKVTFAKGKGKYLICAIEDNGIGRSKAAALQRDRIEPHKSRGMEIIQERIAVLNSVSRIKINCKIEDRIKDNAVEGTKVTLSIPVIHNW